MPQDRHAPRPTIVDELIATLAPHPRGLRRWSVMRAIRANRQAASRDIPFKLESDVERVFRQFCRDSAMPAASPVLFCRPAEKAGEVWALDSFFAGAAETAAPTQSAAAPDQNSQAASVCAGEQPDCESPPAQ
jgi:hypothetical protein